MATIKVYDQEKQEVGSVELAPEVFEVEARPEILNLVVRAQRAAQRAGTHKAKSKVRSLAMRMALSSRGAGNNLLVVKGINLPDGKTKNFAKVAKTLGLTQALVVAPEMTENLDRSSRNLPNVTLTTPDRLSVYEILKNKQLVLLQDAIAPVEARFVAKGK